MEKAMLYLWIGKAESEEVVASHTEWQYGDDEDDYKSWFEKSFEVSDYDQSFRAYTLKESGESVEDMIKKISYGEQIVDSAMNDIEKMSNNKLSEDINALFSAINIEYNEQIRISTADGIYLLYVGKYAINW